MELDKDLLARQEARQLAAMAASAQKQLARMDQARLDRITQAVAKAFSANAQRLAQMAVEETGFGNVADKTVKNQFASETVLEAIAPMQVVGVLNRSEKEKLWQIGVPVGVIGAIVPSTNPTSTVCYKAMIALKSGNSILFSPHPKALKCTLEAAKIVAEAACGAGAPQGSVCCLTVPSMAGCQEMMGAKEVNLILATGGPGMVKAAYSSGKPAIGVGAGNGPAYIHRSADIGHALQCILRSKTFDNGTVCASEQSIIVEKDMEQAVKKQAAAMGYYFLTKEEAGRLAKIMFRPTGGIDPQVVGKDAKTLAAKAGFCVPDGVKILVAKEQEAGPTRPYTMEKLCPVLALFVMDNENAVLEKAIEVLIHEGSGHTFVLHAEDESVVEKFALQIPVSRFLVNTPGALGGIGATTGLFPALTLGCGAVGGSSSSNNISPMDLVNIRRVAWDQKPIPCCRQTQEKASFDPQLVELLTAKILERLK